MFKFAIILWLKNNRFEPQVWCSKVTTNMTFYIFNLITFIASSVLYFFITHLIPWLIDMDTMALTVVELSLEQNICKYLVSKNFIVQHYSVTSYSFVSYTILHLLLDILLLCIHCGFLILDSSGNLFC